MTHNPQPRLASIPADDYKEAQAKAGAAKIVSYVHARRVLWASPPPCVFFVTRESPSLHEKTQAFLDAVVILTALNIVIQDAEEKELLEKHNGPEQ